jgi:predicted nucleic acid-binding protein
MSPEIVVCDTGPVLHLHEADALDLLSLIDAVYMPPGVEAELLSLIGNWPFPRPDRLKVLELEEKPAEQAIEWRASGLLHKGESESLALALQVNAHWYLTDDSAARELAKSLGVEVHGSLGIVLWAAAQGHVDQQRSIARLEALFASSLWVGPAVQEEARQALNEIYRRS